MRMECQRFRDFMEEPLTQDMSEEFLDAFHHLKTCPYCEEILDESCSDANVRLTKKQRSIVKGMAKRFIKDNREEINGILERLEGDGTT
jgi:transcription initiation factor IIE alpha subunit